MIELNYALSETEIQHYYQCLLEQDPAMQRTQLRIAAWVPAGALILGFAFHWDRTGWIIAVLLSLIWIFFLSHLVFNDAVSTAAKRRMKKDQIRFPELSVLDDGKDISVNGTKQEVKNYFPYLNLLIINFENGTNLIVPDRAFRKEQDMEQFIKDVMIQGNQQKGTI